MATFSVANKNVLIMVLVSLFLTMGNATTYFGVSVVV